MALKRDEAGSQASGEDSYAAVQAGLLAPLTAQTYGNLCGPANGRVRNTGILRLPDGEVRVAGTLAGEGDTENPARMHALVALVLAIATGWIVFVAVLIARAGQ